MELRVGVTLMENRVVYICELGAPATIVMTWIVVSAPAALDSRLVGRLRPYTPYTYVLYAIYSYNIEEAETDYRIRSSLVQKWQPRT